MSNGNSAHSGVACPKTAFSDFSDKQLYSCYTSSVWDRLSPEAKQHLLQETANRETIAYGGNFAVNLDVKTLADGVYGVQNGRNVAASKQLVEDGKGVATYNGKTVEYSVPDSNWQSLETVLHEVRHAWQDEVSAGRIQAEDGLKGTFEANNYTVSDVDGKPGIQYMKGVTDERLYLLNPTEADSFLYSQNKTAQIIEQLRNEGVVDTTMDVYQDKLAMYGYQTNLDAIRSQLGEDVDKQVEQSLKNIYNNTNEPVDKSIEQAVKNEMTASYQKMLEEATQNSSLQNSAEATVNNASSVADNTVAIADNASPASGVHDNDAANFDGAVPSLDCSENSGILDNDAEDFDGEAPGLDICEKESDFRDEKEDASSSAHAEDSLSDGDGHGSDDGLGDDL